MEIDIFFRHLNEEAQKNLADLFGKTPEELVCENNWDVFPMGIIAFPDEKDNET